MDQRHPPRRSRYPLGMRPPHTAQGYVRMPDAEFEELLARVEALGRRPKQMTTPILKVADLEVDTSLREARRGGKRQPYAIWWPTVHS